MRAAHIISHNIISPLGVTSADCYQAVVGGDCSICRYEGRYGIPYPFMASLLSEEMASNLSIEGYTRFESIAIQSIRKSLEGCSFDISADKVVFILGTTKGNIDLLINHDTEDERINMSVTAQRIAQAVGVTTTPIVCCNACVSGLSAMLLGQRLIANGTYDYAIVCGADVQSKFVVSGFQSLKSLSDNLCRPFDIERNGLNLGEAAATIILGADKGTSDWHIQAGCIRNDASHISTPSRYAEGCIKAINNVINSVDIEDIAVVNAHGTATIYNDQMESVAIANTDLKSVPVNACKGVFGHTMGASGVVETILTLMATENGMVLPTKGYETRGVSGKIDMAKDVRTTSKHTFCKLNAGFGGCNGVLMVSKKYGRQCANESAGYDVKHRVSITPSEYIVDGNNKTYSAEYKNILSQIYKENIGDYPKFHKMDLLSKLAFASAELLMQVGKEEVDEDCGIILFNNSSSIIADREYVKSIENDDEFFPSPSIFVYTLPNITTGEIAIRHKLHGETSFYILPQKHGEMMETILQATLTDSGLNSIICGWIDCKDEDKFESDLMIIKKK